MPDDPRKKQKAQLALAIARGEPIDEWARQNQVPRRTAFRWAREVKLRRYVETQRRYALDQAIGRLSSLATKATDGILNLAEGAESESVQLRAWRAILADNMAVAKFSNLEHRIMELEEHLDQRNRDTHHTG
jgi:hypothetical protein